MYRRVQQRKECVADASVDPETVDEQGLLDRALSGEDVAFETFLRRHGRPVRELIKSLVGREGPVDDLVHETFMRVFRHGQRRKRQGPLRVWLLRIARNVTIDWHRSQGVRKRFLERARAKPEEVHTRTPLELLENREIYEEVQRALSSLPQHMAETFLLREQQGLSYEEIAEVQGTSAKTVSTRLHRVRFKLQGLLAPFLEARDGRSSAANQLP